MARGLFNLFLRIFEAVGTLSLAISGREREIEGTIIGTFAFKLRATLMSRIAMATIVYKQKPKMVILASKNSNKINTKRVFLRQVAKGSYRKVEGIFYFGSRR